MTRLQAQRLMRAAGALWMMAAVPSVCAAEVARLPMLTISDSEQSSYRGAMIEFFMESGRLRFATNADTVNRSRLKVSSRVLGLAKIVRDQDTP